MKLRGMEVMTVAHEIGLTKIKVVKISKYILFTIDSSTPTLKINLNKDPIE
jgi:phosphoribosylformylglycinamidine (FGAM) synthase PurS component